MDRRKKTMRRASLAGLLIAALLVRLEDVEKAGRGALVEVEEEDGDQVLVWLR
jgi:hypothetical protein